MFDVPVLTGPAPTSTRARWHIVTADAAQVAAHRRLRREVFVAEQGLFSADDHDDADDDPRTVVLVAVDDQGRVLGGVRLAPATARDIGWWTGSRLAVHRAARQAGGIGLALVREACRVAVARGALRFDASVQDRNEPLFRRLGWQPGERSVRHGVGHVQMHWPIDRIQTLLAATKQPLGDILDEVRNDHPSALGGAGFVGDDGAPVPGSDLVAACDAILPAMVDRDPEWAGWCAVLVNVNDLSAMGADPVGLLNAIAAPNATHARRVMAGLRSAAQAWGIPILGGHTQVGTASALTVTALGHSDRPVPGGGGQRGDDLTLTADLSGGWRPGFAGRQWDTTSVRSSAELQAMGALVRRAQPAAAKDVSMAGIIGTTAMLAEASGTGAVVDVAAIPAPDQVALGDWLTCFPGFAMLTADRPGQSRMPTELRASTELCTSATIGTLTSAPGVTLRWPDGVQTVAVCNTATGLGRAL